MLLHRVITALVLLPLVLWLVLMAPAKALAIVIVIAWGIGGYEWGGFMRLSTTGRITYAAVIAGMVAPLLHYGLPLYGYIASLVFWGFALIAILVYPKGFKPVDFNGQDQQVIAKSLIGIILLVPAAIALFGIHQVNPLHVIVLFFLVWGADVGGYLFGKLFGSHKLWPKVSPGKTWEGAAGGVVGAALIAGIASWHFKYTSYELMSFLLLAAVIVVISIVGDLTQSMFKRQAELKDSGSIFPGHGGLLDRLDSLMAAAPLYFFAMSLLGLLRA